MDRSCEKHAEVTDTDVAAARMALVAALNADGFSERARDLLSQWHSLVVAQDKQCADAVGSS